MAAEIAVNTDILARDIGEMRSILDKARAQLKKALEDMEASRGQWEGTAQKVFMMRFMSDYQNTETLLDETDKFINAMQKAKDQYISCANEVNDLIRTIRIE